ncbi:unnamed protein product [Vitrella brassicaformis CCMP3155]|uniref:Acyltransferase n=2 Tax=Vitrella brassicaformis TaxID=1169539 RepID=A0A0G4EU54_VITBC|nr:unnamed protein product [Vitrella brassicaformis CCMP3155]|mmetsp:Transcript_20951/g.59772  ORF Transcript_20951/g.59772 Transcript_20951/m.59772 type:complete len:359 (+) Transcript_20951:236-1312(+)|eukprot:CEM01797.1 unnamed protein product [Vitrella brassicaformis CCMP3155]
MPLWLLSLILLIALALWLLPGIIFVRRDQWAIWRVPCKRRMQTAAVATLYGCFALPVLFIGVAALYRVNWWWIVPYVVYLLSDRRSTYGNWRSHWFRSLSWWKHCRDYWPVELKRQDPSVPLKKDRPYLVGVHPHGPLLPISMVNFFTEATHITDVFQGTRISPTTLNAIFMLPVFREIVLLCGAVSVAQKCIESVLRKGGGHGVSIYVGGAREASQTSDRYTVLVYRRKGFFRLALRYGVYLFPAFTFGENYIYRYRTPKTGTMYYRINELAMRWVGYAVPFLVGRGIFQKSFGLLPQRHRLVTIIGNPIECPQTDNPTEEQIKHYQDLYVAGLKQVFEQFKDSYDPEGKAKELAVG